MRLDRGVGGNRGQPGHKILRAFCPPPCGHRLQAERFALLVRAEHDALGHRMPQEIIETLAVRRVQRQKAILQIPHQHLLAFECAANSFTELRCRFGLSACQARTQHSVSVKPGETALMVMPRAADARLT